MNLLPHAACLALIACAILPNAARAADAPAESFAPLEFLVGHCWRAKFDNGRSDVQCYEWLYDRKLMRNTHTVDSDPPYQGITIYSWDPDRSRIRFHYFTSTGAVSEGHLRDGDDGAIVIPETHVETGGTVTELETRFVPQGPYRYEVRTRQKKDGDWLSVREVQYRRVDSPDLPEHRLCSAAPEVNGSWHETRSATATGKSTARTAMAVNSISLVMAPTTGYGTRATGNCFCSPTVTRAIRIPKPGLAHGACVATAMS